MNEIIIILFVGSLIISPLSNQYNKILPRPKLKALALLARDDYEQKKRQTVIVRFYFETRVTIVIL